MGRGKLRAPPTPSNEGQIPTTPKNPTSIQTMYPQNSPTLKHNYTSKYQEMVKKNLQFAGATVGALVGCAPAPGQSLAQSP